GIKTNFPERMGAALRAKLLVRGRDRQATARGKATGLRCPAWSTARTPNCTLSLAMSSVMVVTLPTSIASVQSAAVFSRFTTWYPARSGSGLAFQVSVVRLVPERVPGGVV